MFLEKNFCFFILKTFPLDLLLTKSLSIWKVGKRYKVLYFSILAEVSKFLNSVDNKAMLDLFLFRSITRNILVLSLIQKETGTFYWARMKSVPKKLLLFSRYKNQAKNNPLATKSKLKKNNNTLLNMTLFVSLLKKNFLNL